MCACDNQLQPHVAEAGLDRDRLARAVFAWRYGETPWTDGFKDEVESTRIADVIAAAYDRTVAKP